MLATVLPGELIVFSGPHQLAFMHNAGCAAPPVMCINITMYTYTDTHRCQGYLCSLQYCRYYFVPPPKARLSSDGMMSWDDNQPICPPWLTLRPTEGEVQEGEQRLVDTA